MPDLEGRAVIFANLAPATFKAIEKQEILMIKMLTSMIRPRDKVIVAPYNKTKRGII